MKKCLAAITLVSVLCWYTPLTAQEAEPSYLSPPELQKLEGLLSKLGQNQPLEVAEANDLLTLSDVLSNLLRAGGHEDASGEIREKLEKMDWYAVEAILEDRLQSQQELAQKLAQESPLHAGEHQRLQELSGRLAKALSSPLFGTSRPRIQKKLAQYGGDAVEATTLLLDNADLTIRLQATLALSGIEDEKASQALLTILEKEKEKEVLRLVAIKGLGKKKTAEAVDGLIKLLSHPMVVLRIASASALKEIGDKKALDGLVKLLLSANKARGTVTSDIKRVREQLDAFKDNILSTAPEGTRWEEVVLTPDEEVQLKSIEDQLRRHEHELAELNLAIIAAAEAISTLTEGEQAKNIPSAQDNDTLQAQINALASWWKQQQTSSASP